MVSLLIKWGMIRDYLKCLLGGLNGIILGFTNTKLAIVIIVVLVSPRQNQLGCPSQEKLQRDGVPGCKGLEEVSVSGTSVVIPRDSPATAS